MELGTKEIMEIIPHRQPFLLIDTVQELEPGVRGKKGQKCVSFNEPYFAGHFPGQPVMPGVLEIEALAQLGAVAILSKPECREKLLSLRLLKSAKFERKSAAGGCTDTGE